MQKTLDVNNNKKKTLLEVINSSKIARYKMNAQKIGCIPLHNEQSQKAAKKIPFTVASKGVKYSGIKSTKRVKYIYIETKILHKNTH